MCLLCRSNEGSEDAITAKMLSTCALPDLRPLKVFGGPVICLVYTDRSKNEERWMQFYSWSGAKLQAPLVAPLAVHWQPACALSSLIISFE